MKLFDACHVAPPLIEYCKGAVPPVACMVIVPSVTPQSVGFVENTLVIDGAFGAVNITGLVGFKVTQVPFA